MSSNSFGHIFRFTSWGESHGPCIGVVVDGVPAGISLNEDDIQFYLNKRRPGHSNFTTQRKEADHVRILSGVFEKKTIGSPVSLIIENQDIQPKDYTPIKDKFRPGHADYSYFMKYGIRDYRGGGRSSARETACRVAAGAIARKILPETILIRGAVIQIGNMGINPTLWEWDAINENIFFSPDRTIIPHWEQYLSSIIKSKSSVGAIIELRVSGVPAGLGSPIYRKLDAEIAGAIMSINAVKSVEIGTGAACAEMYGEEFCDQMIMEEKNSVKFLSNHAGGILGGISTGEDIIIRFSVKPTSSIPQSFSTITENKQSDTISTNIRYDPCIGIRAVPIAEAMIACILADHYLITTCSNIKSIYNLEMF